MEKLLTNKEIDKYGESPFKVPPVKGDIMLFPFEFGKKLKDQAKLAIKYKEALEKIQNTDIGDFAQETAREALGDK